MTLSVPTVGSAAPDFAADTTAGTRIQLSDFRGRQHVLLAFFPLAFTSVCTAEMCAFTEDFDAFASKDVAVVPMSVDAVPALKAFKSQNQIGVELASDLSRATSRAYGVYNEERFISGRAYFLIDKDGVLRWSFIEPHPGTRRENAEILAEIAKLA